MERKKFPVGIENFEEIRKENFYYVDKTGLICLKVWKSRRKRRCAKPIWESFL